MEEIKKNLVSSIVTNSKAIRKEKNKIYLNNSLGVNEE